MIYRIVNATNDKQKPVYQLATYLIDKFKLPDKIYGSAESKAKYIWNRFAQPNGRASVLCTGRKGSGKTLFTKLLMNMAVETQPISEVPITAIVVSEIKPTLELVSFISGLDNAVILIDEFGKLFGNSYEIQNSMLTLLSDSNKRRMFLLTENDTYLVNRFILNRPERIRYHITYDQMENSVVQEYCKDYEVPAEFTKELLKLNMCNSNFNFDQLQAIVSEAKYSNNWDLEWIISILNVKELAFKESYRPLVVTDDTEELKLDTTSVKEGINMIRIVNPNEDSKLLESIRAEYLNVDTSNPNDDRPWRSNKDNNMDLIKVNIAPENLLDVIDNVHVYSDATGKFKVKFEYGKKIL